MRLKQLTVYLWVLLSSFYLNQVNALSLTDLQGGNFDNASRDDRINIARELISYTNLLVAYIPNQKPVELEWLEKERKSINSIGDSSASTSRLIKLVESPEFQHQKLQVMFQSVIDALKCAADKSVNLKRELLCWSVASYHMTDKEDMEYAIGMLRDAGRLPQDIVQRAKLGNATGFGAKYSWYGRAIQEFIIIPYFNGNIDR